MVNRSEWGRSIQRIININRRGYSYESYASATGHSIPSIYTDIDKCISDGIGTLSSIASDLAQYAMTCAARIMILLFSHSLSVESVERNGSSSRRSRER